MPSKTLHAGKMSERNNQNCKTLCILKQSDKKRCALQNLDFMAAKQHRKWPPKIKVTTMYMKINDGPVKHSLQLSIQYSSTLI